MMHGHAGEQELLECGGVEVDDVHTGLLDGIEFYLMVECGVRDGDEGDEEMRVMASVCAGCEAYSGGRDDGVDAHVGVLRVGQLNL